MVIGVFQDDVDLSRMVLQSIELVQFVCGEAWRAQRNDKLGHKLWTPAHAFNMTPRLVKMRTMSVECPIKIKAKSE